MGQNRDARPDAGSRRRLRRKGRAQAAIQANPLGFGLGLVARSKVYSSLSNAVTLPGYARVDAALFFELAEGIEAQVNVENLLGEDYFATAHNDNNIAPGAPRTARATLPASSPPERTMGIGRVDGIRLHSKVRPVPPGIASSSSTKAIRSRGTGRRRAACWPGCARSASRFSRPKRSTTRPVAHCRSTSTASAQWARASAIRPERASAIADAEFTDMGPVGHYLLRRVGLWNAVAVTGVVLYHGGFGLVGDLLIGVLGAVLGGWLFGAMGASLGGGGLPLWMAVSLLLSIT
mgnify:CR=1 FL=1